MAGYLIDARDKPGLLVAFMKELVGNARITFEGDLSKTNFSSFPQASSEPDGVFHRNTIFPRQDYILLPLTQETIKSILAQVLPEGRCVHDILHIQIEKDRELMFSACDQFDPESTWVPLSMHPFLVKLKERGLIRSFELLPEKDNVQHSSGELTKPNPPKK